MSENVNPYQSPQVDPSSEVNSLKEELMAEEPLLEDYVVMKTNVFAKLASLSLIVFVVLSCCLVVLLNQTVALFNQSGDIRFVRVAGYKFVDVKNAQQVSFLITLVLVSLWKYRSMNNAWVLRKMKKLPTVSSGWAVGWYFIPGMNLWKPYVAMKEIMMNTMGEFKHRSLISVWWLIWVVWLIRVFHFVFGGVLMTSSMVYRIRKIQGEIFDYSLIALAGCLLVIIITIITKAQMREVKVRGDTR